VRPRDHLLHQRAPGREAGSSENVVGDLAFECDVTLYARGCDGLFGDNLPRLVR
jgi:hypothetical protein